MQLSYEQLESHLQKQALLPVYLLQGDVSLLIQESCDAIKKRAQKNGFEPQPTLFAEVGFNWNILKEVVDQPNLFNEKIIIEIRNQHAEFKSDAAETLLYYLQQSLKNQCLILIKNKLTPAQKKSQWYKIIDQYGAVVSFFPMTNSQLKSWITNRFKKMQLTADNDSIALLAELTHGNLLATYQAIEKMRLIQNKKPITVQSITEAIHDHGQFTIFDLTDSLLSGFPSQALRIFSALRETNTAIALIIWAIARDLSTLYTLSFEHQRGKSLSGLLASEWKTRQSLLKKAVLRLPMPILRDSFQQLHLIDRIAKGLSPGNAWDILENLIIILSKD